MKKPNEVIINLVAIGWIHGIHIEQKQTGTDTATTFCKITGSNGKCEGRWAIYEKYLTVRAGHNFIAELKREYINAYAEWRDFEKENAKDLAEYERLKIKLGQQD